MFVRISISGCFTIILFYSSIFFILVFTSLGGRGGGSDTCKYALYDNGGGTGTGGSPGFIYPKIIIDLYPSTEV